MIRSDNGSNFTGASAELIQAFQEMDHSRISNYWEEHGGDGSIGKETLHSQVIWGEFGNNSFGVLE